MRESWSLTWDDEWRIARYLGLVGLVMAVATFAVAGLASIGLARANLGAGAYALVSRTLMSILYVPLVYLAAMVPVGIYRALAPADVAAAEVFV